MSFKNNNNNNKIKYKIGKINIKYIKSPENKNYADKNYNQINK
jgi:hypothetical protein